MSVPYDRARFQDKCRIERVARSVCEQLGLDQFAVVHPWQLADDVLAHAFDPEALVLPKLAARVRQVARGWLHLSAHRASRY